MRSFVGQVNMIDTLPNVIDCILMPPTKWTKTWSVEFELLFMMYHGWMILCDYLHMPWYQLKHILLKLLLESPLSLFADRHHVAIEWNLKTKHIVRVWSRVFAFWQRPSPLLLKITAVAAMPLPQLYWGNLKQNQRTHDV